MIYIAAVVTFSIICHREHKNTPETVEKESCGGFLHWPGNQTQVVVPRSASILPPKSCDRLDLTHTHCHWLIASAFPPIFSAFWKWCHSHIGDMNERFKFNRIFKEVRSISSKERVSYYHDDLQKNEPCHLMRSQSILRSKLFSSANVDDVHV